RSGLSCRRPRDRGRSCGTVARRSARARTPCREPRSARRQGTRPGCCQSSLFLASRSLGGDGRLADAQLALAQDRVEPCDVLLAGPQTAGVLELTGRGLETELEQLVLRVRQLLGQLRVVQLVEFIGGELGRCHQMSPLSRLRMRLFMGSLCSARRYAWPATSSSTPVSSNMTRTGLMLAIHHSTEPLPEPMRTSAGFLVSGRSG